MPILLENLSPQPVKSFWNRFIANSNNPNSFITFRETDIQMNMSYEYDTPFGYYFFPVKQAYDNLKTSTNFYKAIPFGSDRPKIIWADLDTKFSDKILRIDAEGNSDFLPNDIDYERYAEIGTKVFHAYLKLKKVSDEKIELIYNYDVYRDILKFYNIDDNFNIPDVDLDEYLMKVKDDLRRHSYTSRDERRFKFATDNNKKGILKTIFKNYTIIYNNFANKIELYENYLTKSLDNNINTNFNRFWYFTFKLCNDAKIWTRLLHNLGIIGVVDEGSGTIHSNEPYQAVFFTSACLGGITVYDNPKGISNLNFTDGEIKRKEFGKLPDTIEEFVEEYNKNYIGNKLYDSFLINYDSNNKIINGNINLSQYCFNKKIKLKDLGTIFNGITVKGNFNVTNIGLITLRGCPISVTKGFYISQNNISSLEGNPKYVSGNYICDNTNIRTTKGISNIVGELFLASNKNLTSIIDIKEIIKIMISRCPNINFKILSDEILLKIKAYDNTLLMKWEIELNKRGLQNPLKPTGKPINIKLDAYKFPINKDTKFKDYILREAIFNQGKLDLGSAWKVYQAQYSKLGNTFTEELFKERAKNWVFYGNIEGWVAVRYQQSGYVKLVATAGNIKGKYFGFEELLSTNPPLWGAVSDDTASILKKKGFIIPNYITMKILLSSISSSVFGNKDIKLNLDGSISVDYEGIGTQKKYFICNKLYIQKFITENSDKIPELVKKVLLKFF